MMPGGYPGSTPACKRAATAITILTTMAALCAVAFAPDAQGADSIASGDKATSARLVGEAERMIDEAGRSHPLDSSRIRAAIVKLKQAADLDPRNDSAYVDLGFAYGVLKDPSTAVDMYRKATMINPSAANFKELADVYLRAGSPEEALMSANAGLSKDPRDAGLYNARGMAMTDLERFDEAERDFRKALEIDPSLAAAKMNLDALGGSYSGRATPSGKKPTRN
jgi:Tfp pilus assembly protein PilF